MSNIWIPYGGGADLDPVTAGAADVRKGKVIVDKNGSPLTGTMAEIAAKTYTPGTANQVIAANQFLAGAQTIKGDGNLTANNIVYGKSIFGVSGNVRKYGIFSGTKNSSSGQKYFSGDAPGNLYYISFAPGFTPLAVTAYKHQQGADSSALSNYGQFIVSAQYSPAAWSVKSTMNSGSLIIPVASGGATYNVLVVGYY